MKIKITALNENNMMIEHKDFYADHPILFIIQINIDNYITQLLVMKECKKIEIIKEDE